MKKHFGFNVSTDNLLKIFVNLGYKIYTKQGNYDFETHKMLPCEKGNIKIKYTGNHFPLTQNPAFTYIDISAQTIRCLMRTLYCFSTTTNQSKNLAINKMKNELEIFKKKVANDKK